jgi:predicted DCC family thiol-disulfide oxidoreductase YuxK
MRDPIKKRGSNTNDLKISPISPATHCGLDKYVTLSYLSDMDPQADRYSFRQNPALSGFDGGDCFTVMDAHCALCAKGAKWIAKNDKAGAFKIVALQSQFGQALMAHYGLDPSDPTSWLFVEDGQPFSSLDAYIRVGNRLGGIWRVLSVLRVIPRPLQYILYRFIARNRYRFFGKADLCTLPDPQVQKRLIQ